MYLSAVLILPADADLWRRSRDVTHATALEMIAALFWHLTRSQGGRLGDRYMGPASCHLATLSQATLSCLAALSC